VLFGGAGTASKDAAAFHALRSAEFAPVTVPVVRRAAFVLVEAGRYTEALAIVREMFAFDAESASDVLSTIRPFVADDRLREGLPDSPEAWLAWSERSFRDGDTERSVSILEEAFARWPDRTDVLTALCRSRVRSGDVSGIVELLDGRTVARGADTALLRVFVAQSLARQSAGSRSRAELEAAYEDAPNDLDVLRHGGDVWDDLDEPDIARRWWNRGRYLVPASNPKGRLQFVVRTAMMEDRRGRQLEALRAWRAVLDLDPENDFARARIRELGYLSF
jgi:tetratricopeptide (TPR) repeat protein